ncbi:DUF3822 family protein [Winogradskyella arenosi]|uniref:Uncharacterized protein DUF3822 n=1 Tax=Winogradskyella arenosi TaxID=533325 RepID=A0A368ZGG7_9FLAO|nr:DUF3822 family protein [Winogradskyella arenosi]RCW92582.1 uncharacterized protein DUF3822 [Winogradskyella arenosi]
MKINDIKELSIQINLNGLSFCILNKTQNSIEFLNTITFDVKQTPDEVLQLLKEELSQQTVFSEDFNAVRVIHQNELSTLVPEELYDEQYKTDYLKFNSRILRNDFITEDRLSTNNSVNVYVPYVNINNYIFDTFGAFEYKHASSILIDALLNLTQEPEEDLTAKAKVYIHVNTASIELLVVNGTQLELFNTFEYYSKEDFLYYILFVFEQLKLDPETTEVELAGHISLGDELYVLLYTYIRHLNFVDKDYNYAIDTDLDRRYLYHYFLILNSFECA